MSARTIEAPEPGAPGTNESSPRVFTTEFLAALERMDGVTTMDDAERARPLEKELAVLFCVAYPTVDRDVSLELGSGPDQEGWFPLRWSTGGGRQRCGELPHFDPETVDAMKSLLSLARNPLWLSYLLELVGGPALEVAGELLCARMGKDGILAAGGGAS